MVSGTASAAQCSAPQGDEESRKHISTGCVKMITWRIVLLLTANSGTCKTVSRNKLKKVQQYINYQLEKTIGRVAVVINCLAYYFPSIWFFITEINYFEYHSLCLCEKKNKVFSKPAELFSPVFLGKVIVRIHQHFWPAWKKIDNQRLHYAFKQACKILNQILTIREVCKRKDKLCEEHWFFD